MNNQELAKIGMMFINWIQVHRESIERFQDFANCFEDDANKPVHSLKEFNEAMEINKQASELSAESKKRYNTLLEEVDLYLASEKTEIKRDNNANS